MTALTPDVLSERARTLLRGAYDTHVHVAPDVVPRRIDDVTLARRFAGHGLAGFQLKSHYTSTAERASVVRAAVPGVEALGAITLNRAVGGMNAVAVEIAAREGARTVWFPTVDSVNESGEETRFPPGAKVPVWMELQRELRAVVLDADGAAVVPAERIDEALDAARLRAEKERGKRAALESGALSYDLDGLRVLVERR